MYTLYIIFVVESGEDAHYGANEWGRRAAITISYYCTGVYLLGG